MHVTPLLGLESEPWTLCDLLLDWVHGSARGFLQRLTTARANRWSGRHWVVLYPESLPRLARPWVKVTSGPYPPTHFTGLEEAGMTGRPGSLPYLGRGE
jgi:hypothetical protein